LYIFVVVFSARALGAGFRPGVFLPRFPLPWRWVGLGGSLLRPYPSGSVLLFVLIASAFAISYKQNLKYDKKKKKKKRRKKEKKKKL